MSATGEAFRLTPASDYAAFVLVLALAVAQSASAQTIYQCKGADARTSYSSTPCAPTPVAAPTAASKPDGDAPAPTYRAPLPKQCDNAAALQFVVVKLQSAATPDDIRGFLADERFRLVRCEYTRLSADERRERDQAMRDLEARDPARRKAAVMRIELLYDRYLTPNERSVRARNRAR